jgi:sn-glycerol 3-phosphate transport system substrate-binding protein
MKLSKKFKGFMIAILLSLTILPTLAACGGAKQTSSSNGKVIELKFWHAMGGTPGQALDQMVKDFNSSQKKIHVTAVYQGNYDDEFNKFKQNLTGSDGPNIMQVYDIGTKFMIDSNAVVPVQDFIDKDKFDTSKFEPNFLAYYQYNNKQYAMPFNSSNPVLYYNKDAFKAAGLDPNQGPTTYQQVEDYAAKLTKKDSSGKVTQYGMAIAEYGWFFEQFLATQNALYANNENGRGDTAATKAVFNSPEAVKSLTWWKDMYDKKIVADYGNVTANTQNAFVAGKAAMILESIGVLGTLSDGAKGKFDIGVAPFPRPDGATGGVAVGGGSLWIPKNQSTDQQQAAWEFIKFASSPKEQAKWASTTGYFATNKDAYNEPVLKDWLKKYPQFNVALQQLHSSPLSKATSGGLIGVFSSARVDVQNAINEVLTGKKSPQQALDDTANKVTQSIQQYNQQVGK